MRITKVEVFLLYNRFVYLKVNTDEGIAGWGEAPSMVGNSLPRSQRY
ncbi:MAG: hypothetical protein QGI86_10555 [Candidatus Poribacteria bacterium]|nr:hypothetical protein [Candidatus Poribacteria bacterium]MDP6749479.1 hypothetical protein [Candidatus Poribacteria bacterium]MDP6996913.1 hypothetical protein [Candidatus Poribacteria bacterium]